MIESRRFHRAPLKLAMFFALTMLSNAPSAFAIVGEARKSGADGLGRAVFTVVGSRGNFCSGTLIANDLILTAAHCVVPGATYKVVTYVNGEPVLRDIARSASHPKNDAHAIASHRATADVALLQLNEPLLTRTPATIGVPIEPFAPGRDYTIAGIGVSIRGDGRTGGIAREATLEATGRPGRLQIRLVDVRTANKGPGLGACTGDSGGPAFEIQGGRPLVVGVISWSTGPNNTSGCGGLTGVTPLTLYRDWIIGTAERWGSNLKGNR